MENKKSIGVFLASSFDEEKIFESEIKMFCKYIAKKESIIFGGSNFGYMGTLSYWIKRYKGYLVGVIPLEFIERGWIANNLDKCYPTLSLSSRIDKMFELSDSFMIFPGGFGTLEELIDLLSSTTLEYIDKPIYLMNLNNYYDPLIKQFENGIQYGFIKKHYFNKILIFNTVQEWIDYIERKL